MANFAPIRDIPMQGITEWEYAILSAMKENIELLTGQRVSGIKAVTNDTLSVAAADNQLMKQVNTPTGGYNISGSYVAAQSDFVNLVNNVQNLANDVARIQNVLNTLITQLRS